MLELILLGLILALLLAILLRVGIASGKRDQRDYTAEFALLKELVARIEATSRDELGKGREEQSRVTRENREEIQKAVLDSRREQNEVFAVFRKSLLEQLAWFKSDTAQTLEKIRETVERKLQVMQEENGKKLEEMRQTVDEKLRESVERRFNESFKLITERLEAVHKGLGEMQTLAAGVGDLKKVLTNVKTRGTFGEVQLGAILEQFLSPEQYVRNDHPDGDRKVVEYAVKLPGNAAGNGDNEPLLLPIDSKFPMEDYLRLVDAYENHPETVEVMARQLEKSVTNCARDIYEKYIRPPKTTDFAFLFVPTEGLFAEILRRPGFAESVQQKYRVIIVGPTNLVAVLCSLQTGFRTLAIQKRSSEVWEILGAVKTQFGVFGDLLEKTKKKLRETANVIDKAGARSRSIERKLKSVEALPQTDAALLLGEPPPLCAPENLADTCLADTCEVTDD